MSTAKLIVRKFKGDKEALMNADIQELTDIDGIGEVIADSYVKYFADEKKRKEYIRLLGEVSLKEMDDTQNSQELSGKTFVITGSVTHFANRKELKELIESMGGKVTGSVTGNTSYLINNDSMSQSAKNKTAAKLNVPVITEEEFIRLAGLVDML